MAWQAIIDSAELQKEGHLLLSVTFVNEADGKKEVRQLRAANSSQIMDVLRAERSRLTGFKEITIPKGEVIDLETSAPGDDHAAAERKDFQEAMQFYRIVQIQADLGFIDKGEVEAAKEAARALFKSEFIGTVI